MFRIRTCMTVLLMVVALAASSWAQTTYTWATPGTSGLFSTAANWSPAAVPSPTDHIVLPASVTPYTVTAGDVHNGIAGNVIVVDISIGNNATLETGDPVNFFANGAITMTAGARLRRSNCPSNQYVFTGTAASSYDPDSIIEITDPGVINFWIDMPAQVGTVVLNQGPKANPAYPGPLGGGNTEFYLKGDLVINQGNYAAAWGYNMSTNVRDFIVDGASSEVRMRNGDVSGSMTVRRDLIVRNGGILRDAAGALVVSSPVVIDIGGSVTNSSIIRELGGVFDWIFRFSGSGTKSWNGAGSTENEIENLEVLGGNTLNIAGATLVLTGSSTSSVIDEVPGGGEVTGTVVENAANSTFGIINLPNTGIGITVAGSANVNVGGIVPVELSGFAAE